MSSSDYTALKRIKSTKYLALPATTKGREPFCRANSGFRTQNLQLKTLIGECSTDPFGNALSPDIFDVPMGADISACTYVVQTAAPFTPQSTLPNMTIMPYVKKRYVPDFCANCSIVPNGYSAQIYRTNYPYYTFPDGFQIN